METTYYKMRKTEEANDGINMELRITAYQMLDGAPPRPVSPKTPSKHHRKLK